MKRIEGFKDYLFTIFGDVYSLKTNKWLKQFNDKDGYLQLMIQKNGINKTCKVHRLIATAFIPNPDNKPQVNHKDGNKQNNCVNNLEWVTQSENQKHAFMIGLKSFKGNNALNHKLFEKDILCIYGLHFSGMKQKVIGKLYNIKQSAVSLIVNGKTWKHLIYGKEF